MLSFFPRGVLDDILNLIESVSEGFLSYFCQWINNVFIKVSTHYMAFQLNPNLLLEEPLFEVNCCFFFYF